MKRSNRIIARTMAAALSVLIGATCALVRCLMGHEFYTCLCVALVACWAILPSPEDMKGLDEAIRADQDDT